MNGTLRLLRLVPLAVAMLWLAGFAHFRGYSLSGVEWAALAALAFALRVLAQRMSPPRPIVQLPPGTNLPKLAALAASLIACVVLALGGVMESLMPPDASVSTPWYLRAFWHGACAFAAAYAEFLSRLQLTARGGAA